MKRAFFFLLLLAVLGTAGLSLGAWSWWTTPLPLASETVEFTVEPGMTPRAVARGWVRAGVQTDDRLLFTALRLSGQGARLRAGTYLAESGDSPERLLDKMVRGEGLAVTLTIPEGWSFAQMRAALSTHPHLKPPPDDAALMRQLGVPGVAPEGRFFPDTYHFARGSSSMGLLRAAHARMQQELAAAWAERDPAVPLKSPDELLILASIVEKETGSAADRGLVAGVFANRLRIGMRLQTDPTVIYGLGERFDGNLRKVDLLTDTPYNSYTRAGLPPTPIALPGRASLRAAARPAATKALYFVARGDGSSVFSETLEAHNRAVAKYQK